MLIFLLGGGGWEGGNLLSSIDWLNVTKRRTIDEYNDLFTEIFTAIAKQSMSFKVVTLRSKDAPWLTSEILKVDI